MNAEQKKELRRQEAREAMAEYTAEEAAARRKTAQLRTLRLAREAEAELKGTAGRAGRA
jgi:hypothetical protein